MLNGINLTVFLTFFFLTYILAGNSMTPPWGNKK